MWQPHPLQAFDGRWRKSRDLRRLLCHKQCNTRQHFAIYIHTDTVCHRCVICSAAYSPLTASCENQPQVLFAEMLQQQSLAGISWFAAAPFASSVKLLLTNLIFSRSSQASVLAGEREGWWVGNLQSKVGQLQRRRSSHQLVRHRAVHGGRPPWKQLLTKREVS